MRGIVELGVFKGNSGAITQFKPPNLVNFGAFCL